MASVRTRNIAERRVWGTAVTKVSALTPAPTRVRPSSWAEAPKSSTASRNNSARFTVAGSARTRSARRVSHQVEQFHHAVHIGHGGIHHGRPVVGFAVGGELQQVAQGGDRLVEFVKKGGVEIGFNGDCHDSPSLSRTVLPDARGMGVTRTAAQLSPAFRPFWPSSQR